MKSLSKLSSWKLLVVAMIFFTAACRKTERIETIDSNETKSFSSEVALKWQDMQLRILRLSDGPNLFGNHGIRYFAYTGIALYESVIPGMPEYQSLQGQLNAMPAMPSVEAGKEYHWPTTANAALAFMLKSFYINTTDANKASVDSLEVAMNTSLRAQITEEIFQRSVDFGKTVAQRIFEWSKTDGSLTVYPTYIPPAGPGLWAPTPPDYSAASSPYWGKNRLIVQGSLSNTDSPLPPAYSTDPNSPFYALLKEVYDMSVNRTPEQLATAVYFRDNPGFRSGTHFLSMFGEILQKENPQLDFYAYAYALTGIALNDASIGCFKIKYEVNQDRPIRYIRDVLNHPTWIAVFNTPNFPDFPSGHSQNSAAFTTIMTSLFGSDYRFTIHTYDNMGLPSRTYNSFDELADNVGLTGLYAGTHNRYSCEQGSLQGKKIAGNILNVLRFKKGT